MAERAAVHDDDRRGYSIFALATNLAATLDGSGGEEIDKRAALFNKYRTNSGMFIFDKTTEDFKNVSANIAGIESIQAASQEHMAPRGVSRS